MDDLILEKLLARKGLRTVSDYKGLTDCQHCGKEFLDSVFRTGPKKKYCSNSCRVMASNKRNGKEKKFPKIIKTVKERKKPHAFIKRRRDVSFNSYLRLVQRYNKIFAFEVENKTKIKELPKLYQLLKSEKAATYEKEIEHHLNNLERRIKHRAKTRH